MDYGERQLWWKSGNAEKPCFCLRFGAPYFYPDRRVTGAFTRNQAAGTLADFLEDVGAVGELKHTLDIIDPPEEKACSTMFD